VRACAKVLKFLGSLVKEKKIVSKAASQNLFRLFFAVIGQFSPVYILLYYSMPQPAFGTIFKITGSFPTTVRVTGDYLKAGTSFLKRVT
jgi:hypothetical protein